MSQYYAFTDREESGRPPHIRKVILIFIGSAVALLLVAHGAGDSRLRGSVPATVLAAAEDQCSGISVFGACLTWAGLIAGLGTAGGSVWGYVTWYGKQKSTATLKTMKNLASRLEQDPDNKVVRKEAIKEVKAYLASPPIAPDYKLQDCISELQNKVGGSPQQTAFNAALQKACQDEQDLQQLEKFSKMCSASELEDMDSGTIKAKGGYEEVDYARVEEGKLKQYMKTKIDHLAQEQKWTEKVIVKAQNIGKTIVMSNLDMSYEIEDFHQDDDGTRWMLYMAIAAAKAGPKHRSILVCYGYRYFQLAPGRKWKEQITGQELPWAKWMQHKVYLLLKKDFPVDIPILTLQETAVQSYISSEQLRQVDSEGEQTNDGAAAQPTEKQATDEEGHQSQGSAASSDHDFAHLPASIGTVKKGIYDLLMCPARV